MFRFMYVKVSVRLLKFFVIFKRTTESSVDDQGVKSGTFYTRAFFDVWL